MKYNNEKEIAKFVLLNSVKANKKIRLANTNNKTSIVANDPAVLTFNVNVFNSSKTFLFRKKIIPTKHAITIT